MEPIDFRKHAVTVWKDGTWKVWGAIDAFYARADPNWLADFGVQDVIDEAVKDHAEGVAARAQR